MQPVSSALTVDNRPLTALNWLHDFVVVVVVVVVDKSSISRKPTELDRIAQTTTR